ncbi:MAG TPA: hypothetical protein VLM40_15625 [Gemmata sp.]|nr:hypothetical protein [Gemmata sp.]
MTPRARSLLLLVVCLAWCSGGSRTAAQEKKESAKQKDAVLANLKKADLTRATLIETKNFLVATTLPREKAAALGALLEKVAPLARKGAQLEEKEEPWKGRLAVYVLPENRDFKSFIRNVVVDQPGGAHVDLRSDNPLVVDPVELPGKATEADQFANTATIVAGTYLTGKSGTAKLPAWLTDGFGRVTVYRAAPKASRVSVGASACRSSAENCRNWPICTCTS